MLVGQCVLLTVDSALTLQSHQSQPLIARAIQILGDDCQTILSHLPFTTAASSTAHFHQTPKSSSTSLNDSTVTPIPLLMSPSPEHCNTNSPLPPPEHQSAHHSTPCITSSENTPELFSQCEEQDFSFSKQSSSSTTPLLRHFTQHPPRNLLLTPELFESHD